MAVNFEFNELLEKVMYLLKIKQKDIANMLEISPSYLTDIKKGNKTVTDDLFDKLREIEKKLDGESDVRKQFATKFSSKKEELETYTNVLLLPTSAQGGSLNDFVVSVKNTDCERVVSPIKDVDFAMQVSGDSMAPEYPNGSRVFIKKINEKAFIEWGKAYVLDTCNGTVIKLLVPSEKEGYVRCLSINQDPIYAPFDVAMTDIFGVYKVLLSMSIK